MSDYVDEINGEIVEEDSLSGSLDSVVVAVKEYEFTNGLTESNDVVSANLSNSAPNMNGVASSGVSTDISRADHTHPIDTSRASASDLTAHTTNISNPHSVTKTQIGLSNVDNTSDADKPISTATQNALDTKQETLISGTNIKTINNTSILGEGNIDIQSAVWGNISGTLSNQTDLVNELGNKANASDLTSHTTNTQNPHSVTKSQVGLGNVTNDAQVKVADKGIANGVATLDGNAKVPTAQLPDVILGQVLYGGEVTTNAVASLTVNAKTRLGTTADTITLTNNTTPITGYKANEGIYYIAQTAFSFAGMLFLTGDWLISRGNSWDKVANTDAVTSVAGKVGAVTLDKNDVGLGNVDNTSDLNKPISTATQIALDSKQATISSSNKISTDYIDDTNATNKFVTSLEKTTWSAKQDALPTTSIAGKVLKSTSTAGTVEWGDSGLSDALLKPINPTDNVFTYVDPQGTQHYVGIDPMTLEIVDNRLSAGIELVEV